MQTPTRDPILEEFCAREPRLLRAEVAPARVRLAGPTRFDEVMLSFDAGKLCIRCVPGQNELYCALGGEGSSSALIEGAEEEPWWRVLGNPLVASWARVGGADAHTPAEITLQFRRDDANPRFVSLRHAADSMSIHCETREQIEKRLAPLSDA